MSHLRPVYGRKLRVYGRLGRRKRLYAVVYDRRNDRPEDERGNNVVPFDGQLASHFSVGG